MPPRRLYSVVLFAIATLWVLVYHAFGYAGHFGFDDMLYARFAAQIARGSFHLTDDHFTYRWCLIFPLGWCYKLFGVNDHASAVYPIIITLLTVALMLYVLRENVWLQLAAVTLLLTSPWSIYYSDKIMPDVLVAFAVLGAVAVLYRERFVASFPLLHAVAFTAFIFFGWLSKETILLCAPLFGFVFISDALRKRSLRFWIYVIVISGVFGIGYLLLVKHATGHYLARVAAINAGSYINPCSYDLLPIKNLLQRIGYEWWQNMLQGGMLIPVVAIVAAIALEPLRKLWRMEEPKTFFVSCAVLAVLCANFMTTSLRDYVPLCPDPRHYLFVVPLCSVAAAYVIRGVLISNRASLLMMFGLIVVTFFSFRLHAVYSYTTYLPATILFALAIATPQRYARVWLTVFTLVLLARPLRDMKTNRRNGYNDQKQLITSFFSNRSPKSIVLTDAVQSHFGTYYMQFDPQSPVTFIEYRDLPMSLPDDSTRCYLLMNGYTMWLSGLDWNALPAFAKHADALPKVAERNGIALYLIDKNLLR